MRLSAATNRAGSSHRVAALPAASNNFLPPLGTSCCAAGTRAGRWRGGYASPYVDRRDETGVGSSCADRHREGRGETWGRCARRDFFLPAATERSALSCHRRVDLLRPRQPTSAAALKPVMRAPRARLCTRRQIQPWCRAFSPPGECRLRRASRPRRQDSP